MNTKHVLLIFPHPDDETLGKAGAVALYTRQGVPVTLICATLGEMGRNMGRPLFANRETLPQIRERELREACRILGIGDLRLLHLRDKTLEFEDEDALADRIEAVIREVQPSVIMTYYPGHGVHPDHDALAAAVVRAVRRLPRDERPVIHASPVTRNAEAVLGPPDIVLDVRSVLDVKLAAMRAHRSQTEGMFKRLEEEAAKDPKVKEEFERNLSVERYWIYRVDE
ncbi:putative N-acetyl-alpha-D-glucosaminyl L-malate deacetylase 2 [Alicyclobacillus cellulosilyticus]|uniref:N-acetyl-alpha-D-glucosaminyl L-malate deacetylase 2 n=1 Tax=Alicyclobacillus cellulosilyticus TaxID=1003997 RepID=A0A917KJN5_9BACL|nr:bacillithiol biosynthesis deacetylase BshB2 [Alicyclobacillus cellulosilyticus]GGJ12441.1 putative N-acetyl-alpha-D-glucosaminyl L-malate deacetylase 2 [Alicyclobacillus cellulosilyticus]